MLDVSLRVGRVLADAVDGLEFVSLHGLEHLGEVPAVGGRDLTPPGPFELGPYLVIFHVLESGEFVGQRTHVTATLHVVLPSERNQAGTPPTHVPGE